MKAIINQRGGIDLLDLNRTQLEIIKIAITRHAKGAGRVTRQEQSETETIQSEIDLLFRKYARWSDPAQSPVQ